MGHGDRQPLVRQPVAPTPDRFPFGPEFQVALLRLLLEDQGLANALAPHLQPHYFEAEPLQWAWSFCLRYRDQYGTVPTLRVVKDQCRGLDARILPLYAATLEQVSTASLTEQLWLRDQALDFVKRNIFVRAFREAQALYNQGKATAAYDYMQEQMEKIRVTTWEPVERMWLTPESLAARQSKRLGADGRGDSIPTGFPWLDKIFGVGISPGEMALWIAYPKTGKTTMLITHGMQAVRLGMKNVLHVVLEGSLTQVQNRYDAAFSEELYTRIKTGEIDEAKYTALRNEYEMFRGKLVIRAFVERWDYSVPDIHEEIRVLKRERGWEPQLVVVDYLDLLRGREKGYSSETEKQRAAGRDLKSLANRGYAVFSACQAQRPKEGDEEKAHYIRARNIADAYDKVRVADFVGSINLTLQERAARVARLLAELYRDNEAESVQVVRADFSRMLLREEVGLTSPSLAAAAEADKLGKVPRPSRMPI